MRGSEPSFSVVLALKRSRERRTPSARDDARRAPTPTRAFERRRTPNKLDRARQMYRVARRKVPRRINIDVLAGEYFRPINIYIYTIRL